MLVHRHFLGGNHKAQAPLSQKTPGPLRVDEGGVGELVLHPLLTRPAWHVGLQAALTSPPCLHCKTLVKGLE